MRILVFFLVVLGHHVDYIHLRLEWSLHHRVKLDIKLTAGP